MKTSPVYPKYDDIPALVLAGGAGTRLKDAVPGMPKVLAPVAGKPFIFHLLDHLASAGITRAILCTGYRADQVEQAVGPEHKGISIGYSREDSPLGTGGGLRLAAERFPADIYICMNGDSFVGADLQAFLSRHLEMGFRASILLTEVQDSSRFGTVRLSGEGRICEFSEKRGLPQRGLINAGVYLISRTCLLSMDSGAAVSIERDLFPSLVPEGIGGYAVRAPFIDIGTPESFGQAQQFFSGKG